MNANKPTTKKYKTVFSETAASIISEMVKKYGLEKNQERTLEKMELAETFQEKEKIFETLPGRQIAKIVKGVAEEKISLKNFFQELQKQLNIPSEDAKKMALELQKKVLVLARKIVAETEKGPKKTTMIKPPPKEFIEKRKQIKKIPDSALIPETEKPAPKKIEKKSKEPDAYREPFKQ